MHERERRRDDFAHRPGDDASPGDDTLEHLHREGADLLRAADEAISRALSGDSERFVAASRQRGGE